MAISAMLKGCLTPYGLVTTQGGLTSAASCLDVKADTALGVPSHQRYGISSSEHMNYFLPSHHAKFGPFAAFTNTLASQSQLSWPLGHYL